jgi:hypothetical protein
VIPSTVYHYRDPAAVALGLRELRFRGLTPRGLLFIAVDPRGETYIAVPDDLDVVGSIKVGDKLTLKAPWQGRYFHFDAIHRLPGDTVLFNGDRRLADAGSASEVACAVAHWLKSFSSKNVFLGCTAHQPGSWWCVDERSAVIDLHASGLTSTVVTNTGLLARKLNEPHVYYLDFQKVRAGELRDGWVKLFTSDAGNILMLERRAQNYRLALSCTDAVIEIDISGVPDEVRRCDTVKTAFPIGVVGRVDGGAFAVTTGELQEWGFANLRPAQLIGSPNETIADLPGALERAGFTS